MSGDRLRIGDRTERSVLFAAEAFRAFPEGFVKLSATFDDRVVFFDGVLQEREGVGAVFTPEGLVLKPIKTELKQRPTVFSTVIKNETRANEVNLESEQRRASDRSDDPSAQRIRRADIRFATRTSAQHGEERRPNDGRDGERVRIDRDV